LILCIKQGWCNGTYLQNMSMLIITVEDIDQIIIDCKKYVFKLLIFIGLTNTVLSIYILYNLYF